MHYFIAVDYSPASVVAFSRAAASFVAGVDSVSVVYVTDPYKEYPFEQKPKTVEEFYTSRCASRFPPGSWTVKTIKQPSGSSIKKALVQYATAHLKEGVVPTGDALLVLGSHGRKGPKEHATVLGSNADYSLREAHMPSLIVKGGADDAGDVTYLVAVDGSTRAQAAAEMVLRMSHPRDTIVLLHVADRDTAAVRPPSLGREETGCSGSATLDLGEPLDTPVSTPTHAAPPIRITTTSHAPHTPVAPLHPPAAAAFTSPRRSMDATEFANTNSPRSPTAQQLSSHRSMSSVAGGGAALSPKLASLSSFSRRDSASVAAKYTTFCEAENAAREAERRAITAGGAAGGAGAQAPTGVVPAAAAVAAAAAPRAGATAGGGLPPRATASFRRLSVGSLGPARPLEPRVPITFKVVPKPADGTIVDALVNTAEELGALVLVIGVDGISSLAQGKGQRLGSVSDAVVQRARCSVLCYQERAETFDDAAVVTELRI